MVNFMINTDITYPSIMVYMHLKKLYSYDEIQIN
jgi:hypothetical protein